MRAHESCTSASPRAIRVALSVARDVVAGVVSWSRSRVGLWLGRGVCVGMGPSPALRLASLTTRPQLRVRVVKDRDPVGGDDGGVVGGTGTRVVGGPGGVLIGWMKGELFSKRGEKRKKEEDEEEVAWCAAWWGGVCAWGCGRLRLGSSASAPNPLCVLCCLTGIWQACSMSCCELVRCCCLLWRLLWLSVRVASSA
jgi:hypothetical protein